MHTRSGIVIVSALVLIAFGCGPAEEGGHEEYAAEQAAVVDAGTGYGADLALAEGI